eukprot:Seg731.8 transcript_id=Seg731.8/GoldUCD/mRNA.D3Y31 product=Rhodopsin protein_id=Seg731.8/GoldUCD/D3Y31
MLLGALCSSDLFIGLVTQPLYWVDILHDKFHFHHTGKSTLENALDVLLDISFGLSFTFVILISLDRYVAICHPYRYHGKVTCKGHLRISVISGIVIASLFCLDKFFPSQLKSSKAILGLTSYLRYIHYILPFVMILFCYVKIYLVILKQRRAQVTIEEISDDTQRQELHRKKQEKDKACTIAIILVCFFICYGPNFAVSVLEIDGMSVAEPIIIIWATFMLFASSLLNPIVYYLRSTEIRKAAKRTIYLSRM